MAQLEGFRELGREAVGGVWNVEHAEEKDHDAGNYHDLEHEPTHLRHGDRLAICDDEFNKREEDVKG